MSQFCIRTSEKSKWLLNLCLSIIFAGQIIALWLDWYRIFIASFIAAMGVLLVIHPKPRLSTGPSEKAFLSLLSVYLYMAASTLWSPITLDAVVEVAYALAATMPALLFGYLLGRRFYLHQIASSIKLGLLFFCAQIIVSGTLFGNLMLINDFNMRSVLSGFLSWTFPLLLAVYSSSKKLKDLVFVIICTTVVVISSSRALLLTVLLGTIYWLYKSKLKAFAILIFSISFVLALIFVNYFNTFVGRFSSNHTDFDISQNVLNDFQNPTKESVDIHRRLAAYISLEKFTDNPIIGGGYSSVFQTNRDEFNIDLAAHGFIPGTLGELGFIGFVIIGIFIFNMLSHLKFLFVSAPPYYKTFVRGYSVSFLCLLAFGLFHQILESPYFTLLAGILLGTSWTSRHVTTFSKKGY